MNEVVDLVDPGVRTADDAGERHGCVRRRGGADTAERTHFREAGEVRQAAEAHEIFDNRGVHSVEGHEERFFPGRSGVAVAAVAGSRHGAPGGGACEFEEVAAVHVK